MNDHSHTQLYGWIGLYLKNQAVLFFGATSQDCGYLWGEERGEWGGVWGGTCGCSMVWYGDSYMSVLTLS